MFRTSKGHYWMAVLIAIATVSLVAQPPAAEQGHKRLAQFKKLKLIETLDLDEQTAEKFFVRYNEGQKKIDQARKELHDAVDELEAAVKAKVSDSELNGKSEQVVKRMQQFAQAITERLNAVRHLLTPQQYAKLVVFEVRFMESLQRALLQRDGPDGRPGIRRDRRLQPPLEKPD
ncbi:MAG: hypothetical protein N2663_00640 [Chlorobi bacterium]|nr:hypothetical protein [Chlorobiota bacterium]